jgi:hypothetical protein
VILKSATGPEKKRNKIRKNVTQYLDISTTIREEKRAKAINGLCIIK